MSKEDDEQRARRLEMPREWAAFQEAWERQHEHKKDLFFERALEYGGHDLYGMAAVMGKDLAWACVFYAVGKACRAISAWEAGKKPSEDTLRDLAVYADMAWLCFKGEWPE